MVNSPASVGLRSITEDDTSDDEHNIEMRPLVSEEGEDRMSDVEDKKTSPIKLLLIRTPWYIIGLVVLVTGIVLSQYTIHVPYQAQCDDQLHNITNSTSTNNTNITMDYMYYEL